MSDHKYQAESYVADSEEDETEPAVRDLGHIIEDRDDRRILLVDGTWDRLDDLDTDEALETDHDSTLPLDERSGAPPPEAFATLYNLGNLESEEREEEFVETSMLATDPDGGVGAEEFPSSSDLDNDGRPEATDIRGHAPGIARGFGTSLPMDIGADGFQIRDNPLIQRVDPNQPISNDRLSDEALGLRDVDEMGSEADLDRLADQAARQEEKRPGR